jgi:hypothetical protein|tara:strand:- start:1084 stop:1479 length:396 start_codon:yes stop_codon:yes gene_type:complete
MAIKETDNTTRYTNLAIEDPKGAQEIIQFLSGITDDRLEFNASEYDAVVGFFEGKDYDRQAAESLAYIILRQAKIDNVPVFEILQSLSKVAPVTLSQLVTEILNSNRYKTSVLGFRNERTTLDHITRNIKA